MVFVVPVVFFGQLVGRLLWLCWDYSDEFWSWLKPKLIFISRAIGKALSATWKWIASIEGDVTGKNPNVTALGLIAKIGALIVLLLVCIIGIVGLFRRL